MVGTNFEEVVYDPAKNVLVLLYTSWNWETKELLEQYAKLAEMFKKEDDVVIAKMDMVENDAEGLSVHNLPTLLLFKAGGSGKERVEMEGMKSLEEMKAFVEKNRMIIAKEQEEL